MKDKLFETFYEMTKKPYQKYFKKSIPWNVKPDELIRYNEQSLGYHYGNFILKNNFQMQPKLEDHDVFHVLTNIGTTVSEEIAMQYFLFGNGKKSLYLVHVILSGTTFYPTHYKRFYECYHKGKKAHRLYDLDYQKLLLQPISVLKQTLNIK